MELATTSMEELLRVMPEEVGKWNSCQCDSKLDKEPEMMKFVQHAFYLEHKTWKSWEYWQRMQKRQMKKKL